MHKLRIGEIRRHTSKFSRKTFDYKITGFMAGKRIKITIVESWGEWNKGEKYIDQIRDHENDEISSVKFDFLSPILLETTN